MTRSSILLVSVTLFTAAPLITSELLVRRKLSHPLLAVLIIIFEAANTCLHVSRLNSIGLFTRLSLSLFTARGVDPWWYSYCHIVKFST